MREIPSSALTSLFQLTTLSLRSNQISKIEKNAFNYSRNLIYLYLQENTLEVLPNEGFNGLSRLNILDISNNRIKRLFSKTFAGLSSLEILDISNNRIKRLFSKTFAGLSSLEILKMRNNLLSLKRIAFNAFYGLRNLKKIYVDESILCCYAGGADSGGSCLSPTHQLPLTKNEFSDCSDMMKNRGVQVCVWILGLTALLGNLLVILMRVVVKEDNKVHSFLLTNLAMSDLLMGIYLLIITMKDVQWQGVYFAHDYKWRSGVPCALTGVLSMVSSEVSVLMLTVITTDRLICVVFPFKVRRMNRSVALAVVGGVWVFGVLLSVIPILGLEYFYDKKRNVGFYGKSAVCLPLQLSAERMAGWEYAVGIFIGLNFVSFVYILVAYIVMFMSVKSASKKVRSTNMKRESQMARRMLFIILTDFLCWMPVILIGVLSLLRKFHDPEKQAYVWIAVFVLPVNSSINPILYTFSTPNVRMKVKQMKNLLFSFIARKLRRSKVENASRQVMKSTFGRNIVAPKVFSADIPSSMSSYYNHISRHNPGTSSKTSHEVQEYGAPEKGLKIVNTSNILPQETSNLVGFVVACRENAKESAMRLIKHFSSECEDDWKKESCLVNELGETEHPNILTYCWHCKAHECDLNFKRTLFPRLRKSAFLLCYDFTESTPLDEYLKNKKIVLNLDTLFVVAVDLIDAIQCLENRGIVHNNITTSTVLIAEAFRVPPMKAILAGFGSSQLISRDFPDCNEKGRTIKDILGKNVVQFGCLLTELMRNCSESGESDELQGIVHLCSKQDADVRPSASQIGDLLRDLLPQNDICDTSV
ncbi:PREDICTED: G-protein coupled receptor GRL101-like isoform X2 [Acropora digitifera]|uniref:G-protein coupled receptor GRL101-like isoform X2 n=1 Tax=Acropora digitifera TaxID=70779 RepID=UPI00077B038E|nr:PREDICTED: G-protein coupled receptor GRL101-like isoform X2 [Acropora digitifera]